ncbi:MAG: SLBB domain-containing protein [Balneolaceae bacterium]
MDPLINFRKRYFFATLFIALLTLISLPQVTFSQDFSGIDFASVNVDNLSDAQIRQIWDRAQDENLSVQEIGALAQTRGMPPAEVSKLRTRLNEVRFQTDTDAGDSQQTSLRQVEDSQNGQDQMEIRSDVEQATDSLRIFGADLFRRGTRTFEPSFNIPTPVDYTLGAGDEIVINIWGAAEANYNLTVSPEGVIRINNLGPIFVDGLTMIDARDRILNRLRDIYSGLRPNQPGEGNTFAEVSLGNVRSIKVTVLGEVDEPGSYTITSLSSVFNALYAAGGPTRSGTYREIQVIRGQEIIARLDIYDFLVYGDQSDNIRLRDQDIIKIDPYKNRVRLDGEVKRPGLFEMKEGETLGNLIEFAAGFTERAYTNRLVLRRSTELQRSISDVRWPEGSGLVLQGGDDLRVGEILDRFENRVAIRGAVYREGEYELDEDMTLTDLIDKAEGLREDAYLPRGIIYRTRDNLVVETIPFSVENVRDGVADDLLLKRDDIVQISSLFDLQEEQTLRVSGAVNQGGEFPYVENLTLKDAIYLADGFRNSAAPYRIEVARRLTGADRFQKGDMLAERFEFDVDSTLQFSKDGEEFLLQPFDQIFVRSLPNYRPQQTVQVEGEVQFPGSYVLENRTARISDLIEWSGGLSRFAYPQGASLSRTEIDEVGTDVAEQLQEETEIEVTDSGSNKVGIKLIEILQNPGSPADLKLLPGDVLNIPVRLETVRVEGAVLYPVNVQYRAGMSLRDFVDNAGGYADNARKKRSYVVYANGEVDRSKKFLFFRNDPPIEPGATIIIPAKDDEPELSPQERIAIYSTIVSMRPL